MFSTSSMPVFQLNRFVGRQSELAEAKCLLTTQRLLTLTGPAGIGKTRLALQLAADLSQEFEYSIHFVALDNISNFHLVADVIAQTLNVHSTTYRSSHDNIRDHLRGKQTLLLLDNFEQVISAGPLLTDLLTTCTQLKVLVTSREILHLHGEQVFRVPPLALPPCDVTLPIDDLPQYAAVELFIQRAQAIRADFALTADNAQAIVRVCQRLDGLPWTIELAAARVNMLSVEQIAARLDTQFWLLTEVRYPILSHHQTLHKTIEWSYVLLTYPEQVLFCRLSVFAGRFTLEDAEVHCMGEGIEQSEVLDLLSHLVDKSLVMAEMRDNKMCYRLLEIFRLYARDKLVKLSETVQMSDDNPTCAMLHAKKVRLTQETECRLSGDTFDPANEKMIQPTLLPNLRIFALGPLRIYRSDCILPSSAWTYTKARSLLFYLLCHPAETKEQIGLALWPNISQTQLRDNFRVTLHHLRRALGHAEWIVFENQSYSFNHTLDYRFDVEAFELNLAKAQCYLASDDSRLSSLAIPCLEEAVQLYQGDFLSGLTDEWHLLHQEELRRKYLEALLTLGQLLFVRESYEHAARIYRQVIAHDSYVETAHRGLMRCYARQGERGQALRHYQTVATLLQNEMGVPPAPETVTLFEHLRRGTEI